MMEPDVRMETNKLGFCKTHFEQMRACKNRLSLALMLQSHLQDMQKHIFTRKKMFEGKTAKQKKVSAVNNECFVCSKVDWGMSRHLIGVSAALLMCSCLERFDVSRHTLCPLWN